MISFIIPAKNEENRIYECLTSIINLNFPNNAYEILVIDNGSSDDTVNIAKSFGAIVYSYPGATISTLRNTGARLSTGDYLAFIDADVTIDKEWVNVCLKTVYDYNSPAVGASPQIPNNSTWVERAWHMQILARENACQRPWIASMSFFIDKKVFEEVGAFDEKLITCEDVDLGYRISKKYKIIYNKDIKSIHHGEAKTLVQLFIKERWRGRSGFYSFLKNHSDTREIFSLVSFLMTSVSLIVFLFSIIRISTFAFLISINIFLIIPLIRTIRVIYKLKSAGCFFTQLLIWSTYTLARTVSFLQDLLKYFFKFFIKYNNHK